MTLKEQFESFDAHNPQVFDKLAEIALTASAYRDTWGIAALFERLRWISEFETIGDPYKMNNNYRAFYARKLMVEYPELVGFFHTRRQRNEDHASAA